MQNAPSSKCSPFQFLQRLLLSFLLIAVLSGCESRKVIVNGLEEKDANEILVFLSGRGIDAVKVQAAGGEGAGGARVVLWNISVETSQANEAMALLNQAGLPRRRGQNLLNIFGNVGLVPSGMEQKVRYQAGLGEQIASVIRKFEGVLDADVQISFPEEDPLNPQANRQKITASVYVKHSGVLDDPNAHLVTRIKRLVSGSVPNLDYDNVTVIGDRIRGLDASAAYQASLGETERNYVNVWSITLARDSLTRFRIIFFSLIFATLILLLSLIWLLWKFFPLLKQMGGFKALMDIHPFPTENLPSVETAKPEEASPTQPPKEGEEGTTGKGIDET